MEKFKKIKQLSELNFSNRGESFVESKFLTPLLDCLGYESHNDYEVRRHGDTGTSFKLNYPPVEKGAKKVKYYNPDYMPTIRKKIFWIIEAKSPKLVPYPFEYKYIVQGLQYCIHPEIQAKYLVLSNGKHTCIYDPHSAIFFNENIYEPVFEFRSNEVYEKWEEVYNFLGVEKLRSKIEDSLKSYYEKLCLSSLDEDYPEKVGKKITSEQSALKHQIRNHVAKLYVKMTDDDYSRLQHKYENFSLANLENYMKNPVTRGKEPSQHYVEKLLKEKPPDEIFSLLISNYNDFSFFQKQHSMVAVCHLHNLIGNSQLKQTIKAYVLRKISDKIPILNKAESAFLRVIRKLLIIGEYPKIRQVLSEYLRSLPEIDRFVNPPTPLYYTYPIELILHDHYFKILKNMTSEELELLTQKLLKEEAEIEQAFTEAWESLPGNEKEINGFESYGLGDKMYTLGNIAKNFGIISREHLDSLRIIRH